MFDLCYVFEVQTQLTLVFVKIKGFGKKLEMLNIKGKKISPKHLTGWLSRSHGKFQNLMVNWLLSHSMSLKNLACMRVVLVGCWKYGGIVVATRP